MEEDLTSEQRWPTMHRLARDLKDANAPEWMVDKALSGFYDDYHPNAPALNMTSLLSDMRKAGLPKAMQLKVIDGEWDATKEESDAWAQSPEGQKTFTELFKSNG